MNWKTKLLLLIKLGRLPFLFGGILLYITGVLLGIHLVKDLSLAKIIFGYIVFGCAHLSVSYSNDYFDFSADKFNNPSLFSGGSGVLQEYPELRSTSRSISIFLIILSLVLAVIFTAVYSMPLMFLVLVIAGNFLGWFYSAPPLSLSYRGWGEVSTMLTVGFLVQFFGFYTVTGKGWFGLEYLLDQAKIFVLLGPMLFFGIAFIVNVQIPDMEADRLGGKNTVVSRKGRSFSFFIIFISNLFAFLSFLALWFLKFEFGNFSLLGPALITFIPLFASTFALINRESDKKMSEKLSALNMSSAFLFWIVLNIYLFFKL